MPQQQQLEGYTASDPQVGSVDPVADINASLQELAQILSGQGPETREEEVVTQETQEAVPSPPAEEMPPPDESPAQARLRAARSALANSPFSGTRTA